MGNNLKQVLVVDLEATCWDNKEEQNKDNNNKRRQPEKPAEGDKRQGDRDVYL